MFSIYLKFALVFLQSNSIDSVPSSSFSRIKLNEYKDRIREDHKRFLDGKRVSPDAKIETYVNNAEILHNIATKLNKNAEDLTIDEIMINSPLFQDFNPIKYIPDMFFQDFSALFQRYYDIYEENQYRRFLLEKKGYQYGECFTDEEFVEKYKDPPWIALNEVIKAAKLGFSITIPQGLYRDAPFRFLLVDDNTGREVPVTALSSGEKVIMGLAFALYNFTFDIRLPDLILMDEPDASLHPSMTKQFLDVVENVFVREKGIKVIMTTHSPSTIALAPENSLFLVEKNPTKIERTTKDKALKILTTGVPSLSVNYENRKQVVVESKIDEYFYGKLYEKLKNKLESEISLSFIASSNHKNNEEGERGGCSEVRKLVNVFRKNGNRSIFGIIDWDRKNSSNEGIKVLGENKRYSIENYIFDPILFTALLLDERCFTREHLGLINNEHYGDFRNLSIPRLQTISDFFINEIINDFNPLDTTKDKVKYTNGTEIEIPRWYLHYRGHDLATKLIGHFNKLGGYKNKENELREKIINKIIDDIPEFIPIDILEIFQSIQKF